MNSAPRIGDRVSVTRYSEEDVIAGLDPWVENGVVIAVIDTVS